MNWTLLTIVAAVLIGLYLLKRTSFVPAETARALLRQGALVVDVRSPDEFESAHLPSAVNLPLGGLKDEASRRFPDKSRVLLLHCLSGARSGIAKQQLKAMGYTQAFNLGSYGRAGKLVREAEKQ